MTQQGVKMFEKNDLPTVQLRRELPIVSDIDTEYTGEEFEKLYMSSGDYCVICSEEGHALCSPKCLKVFKSLYTHSTIPFKPGQVKLQRGLGRRMVQFHKSFSQAFLSGSLEDIVKKLLGEKYDKEGFKNTAEEPTERTSFLKDKDGDFSGNALASLMSENDDDEAIQDKFFEVIARILTNTKVAIDYIYGCGLPLAVEGDNAVQRVENAHQYMRYIYPKTYKKELVQEIMSGTREVSSAIIISNIVWFLIEIDINPTRASAIHKLLFEALIGFIGVKEDRSTELLAGAVLYSGFRNSMGRTAVSPNGQDTSPFPYDVLVNAASRSETEHEELKRVVKTKQDLQNKLSKIEKVETRLKQENKTQKKRLSSFKGVEKALDEAKTLRKKNDELQALLTSNKRETSLLKRHEKDNKALALTVESLKKEIASHGEEYLTVSSSIKLQPIAFPKSAKDLLVNAQAIFSDRLIIAPEAIESADSVVIDQATVEKAWSALEALANFLWGRRFEKGLVTDEAFFKNETGLTLSMSESSGVKKNSKLMSQRAIFFGSEKYFATPHIKIGTKAPQIMRIHFVFLEKEKKILVAHFGEHLDNASTRKR